MPGAVYHPFSANDIFETRVTTWPSVVWASGNSGVSTNLGFPSGTLSLYGGVRARDDVGSGTDGPLMVYPIDQVDTHSIDKVIGIPGQYPASGSINIVYCSNENLELVKLLDPTAGNTDTRWYDTYYRTIEVLHRWHAQYSTAYDLFDTGSYPYFYLFHVPEMFYGRQMATGTVQIIDWSNSSPAGVPNTFIDDGHGKLMLSGTTAQWGTVFYVEGLIVLLPPVEHFDYIPGQGTSLSMSSYHAPVLEGSPVMVNETGSGTLQFTISTLGPYRTIVVNVIGPTASFQPYIAGPALTWGQATTAENNITLSATSPEQLTNIDFFVYPSAGTVCNLVHATTWNYLGQEMDSIYDSYNSVPTGEYVVPDLTQSYPLPYVALQYNARNNSATSVLYSGTTAMGSQYNSATHWSQVATYIALTHTGTTYFGETTTGSDGTTSGYAFAQGRAYAPFDNQIQLSFSGSHRIIAKTFMCRAHEGELNCSRNPTWASGSLTTMNIAVAAPMRFGERESLTLSTSRTGALLRSGSDNTTYISSVGLYNEDYELVAVAKLAQPIRKRERDRLDIRLRLDF